MRTTRDVAFISVDAQPPRSYLSLIKKVAGRIHGVKIKDAWEDRSLPLYGQGAVRALREAGAPRVWVDVPLCDTPERVYKQACAIKSAGADIVSVHAAGLADMMIAARDSGAAVYGHTNAGSAEEFALNTHYRGCPHEYFLHLVQQAELAQIDGIVCTPGQVGELRSLRYVNRELVVSPGPRMRELLRDQKEFFNALMGPPAHPINQFIIGSPITQTHDAAIAFLDLLEPMLETTQEKRALSRQLTLFDSGFAA